MLKSFGLFVVRIFKSIYFWISLIFLFYAIFDVFIKPYIPEKYQNLVVEMPIHLGFILFAIMIFIACFSAYHKLRMTRLEELYKYLPEANEDRIFRIFYKLYKEGCFLKNANTDRRQRWDIEVLKEIKNYCHIEFEHIYLLNTGRRNYEFTPLDDSNYDTALSHLKNFIDRDFDKFIKS